MEEGAFRVALVQMDSKDDVDSNLSMAVKFLKKAKEGGAQLVVFPETMNFLPFSRHDIYSETIDGRTVTLFKNLSKEYAIDIHLGSILITSKTSKPYNSAIYIDSNGEVLNEYRKIHLFDATLRDGSVIRESDLYQRGNKLSVFKTKFTTMGSLICYDIRFPESFRNLALLGAKVIIVPSGFSFDTGLRHWEVLLRARAIENNVFILAPDQCGQKKKYKDFGNTMAIDPDGNIIGALNADEENILFLDINPKLVDEVREKMPNLKHIVKL